MKSQTKRVAEELAGVKEDLKKARKAHREENKLVELREVWKTYTPKLLGHGRKGGGTAEIVRTDGCREPCSATCTALSGAAEWLELFHHVLGQANGGMPGR